MTVALLALPQGSLRVSPHSLFADDHWQMATGVVGQRDTTFRIDWSFALPDGSRFSEPRWRTLREASKHLLWSLHSDPPPGRPALSLRSLGTQGTLQRVVLEWMAGRGLTRWSELDGEAIRRLFDDLARRPNVNATMALSTASNYRTLLRAFYQQRGKLPDTPRSAPPALSELGEWRPIERWPYTPDKVAVPLVAGALHLIGEPAEVILRMRDDIQALHDAARERGNAKPARSRRIRRYLRSAAPVELAPGQAQLLTVQPMLAFNGMVARLYEACFVVIAYLVGPRASEILSLEAGCIERVQGEQHETFAYLTGTIRKDAPGNGVLHRWVAPEPAVRAIEVLERLSAPWRAIDGRPYLWLIQTRPGSAIRSSALPIEPLTSSAMNIRLNDGIGAVLGLAEIDGGDWRLATHQGRKTFARFVGRRDRTGLAALAKHLGHATRAMTDRAYVGTDFELAELVDAQAARETRAALEELLVAPRLGGKAGRELAARSPFRGRTHDGDLDTYISSLVAETDIRLGVCDWGYCLYRRETSACIGSNKEPNPVLRTQGTCVTCANFAVSEHHKPVWEARLQRNLALLERADLDPESRNLAMTRVEESRRVIRELDPQVDDGNLD
ncbi:integrase [uncultured Bradyrhizobium sp.]|uniref:integrase n=2 Tax=Pseudomonadota TaxID=1224 RepID=UPI002622E440|nr:integrase [uncultured Bradyrhizobium sp.]